MRALHCIVGLALLLAGTIHGQLSLGLTPSTQIGTATNEITFAGALTNASTTNLYLNDVQCTLLFSASNALVFESNAFFANVPGILSAGEVYADVVFGITLGSVAPPGAYNGTITILGGSNIFAESNLVTASFHVTLPSSVGDGIPDWWRQLYFGGDGSTTNGESCATCDADGTGQDNEFKYVVGLNPVNRNAVFMLSVASNFPPSIAFGPVAAGRLVVPEYSGDLASGLWRNLTIPIATLTNATESVVSDPDPSANARFYRVQVYLP